MVDRLAILRATKRRAYEARRCERDGCYLIETAVTSASLTASERVDEKLDAAGVAVAGVD
jgi:hypothetical protein